MTKPIEDYTVDELSAKIEAIKAEREETAKTLKCYEEELERRKNENWLPLTKVFYSSKYEWRDFFHVEFKTETIFNDYSCFDKYRDYLETLNKELVANAKGEQIDINVLLPLLPKGHWVACDSSGEWFVFSCKPFIRRKAGSKDEGVWDSERHAGFRGFLPFNLKPAENWGTSLMECGL